MGLVTIMKRGGDDYREYKKAVKMAKEAIETICELTEEMEDEFGYSERGYGERSASHMRGGYSRRDDWDGSYEERRGRDSRGRYM